MVSPERFRGAELDFWSCRQKQHSVLCKSGMFQAQIYTKCLLTTGDIYELSHFENNNNAG